MRRNFRSRPEGARYSYVELERTEIEKERFDLSFSVIPKYTVQYGKRILRRNPRLRNEAVFHTAIDDTRIEKRLSVDSLFSVIPKYESRRISR